VYWVPRLGEELNKADIVLLVIGETIGQWQELEYYEALRLSRLADRGRPRIVPVLITEHPAPGLAFLSTLHQIFALELSSTTTLSAIERAFDAVPVDDPIEPWRRFQPYKGLPSLAETDAAFFFGRENEVEAILNILARNTSGIVTLIGQSGVGKSSLVFAGILSRLKSQLPPKDNFEWPSNLRDSRSHLQINMRPGRDPIKEFAVSIVKLYGDDDASIDREASGWANRFRDGSRLRDMLRLTRTKIAEKHGGHSPKGFILYVDQAEELYTRAPSAEARTFSQLLASAIEDDAFSIITSLRSDFYAAFQNDDALSRLSTKFDVLPLKRDVLIDVIRKPAELLGVRFEDKNIPALIAEATQSESGALPLLSDLMQEMWLNMVSRGDGVLRWSDQPGMVDIGLPLKRRADAFLKMATTDTNVVRRLFTLRLASVAPVGDPVRRRASKSECEAEEWLVAERLAASDQRLLTISNPLLGGEPIVEVAHEQILTRWPQLKSWLDDQRDFLIWRTETEEALKSYNKLTDRVSKSAALLMGYRLTTAAAWLQERESDLARDLVKYIKESIARQESEEADRVTIANRLKQAELEGERLARIAAEKAQELESSRANVAEQKQAAAQASADAAREKEVAARKLSRFSFAAAAVSLALLILAGLEYFSAHRATMQAVANESRALAALSRTAIDDGLGNDGVELALASWPRSSSDSRPQLRSTLQALAGALALRLEVLPKMSHQQQVVGASYTHGGAHILSWSRDGTVRLWDAATGAADGSPMMHDETVSGATTSKDDKLILSWSLDGTVRLWDSTTGAQKGPTMKHDALVVGASFSPDENKILSWSRDNTLRLWNAATSIQVGPSMKHDGGVIGGLFSRSGDRVLSWSFDKTLRLWDVETSTQIGPPMNHEGYVVGASFSRDGQHILSWSRDGTLRKWDVQSHTSIAPPMRHNASVTGGLFSEDGRFILSWSSDKTVRLWDAETGAEACPPMKHNGLVNGAVFSPDRLRILSWSSDKTLRQWDVNSCEQIASVMMHDGSVTGASFSRDGHLIMSWSDDSRVRLWSARSGELVGSTIAHESSVGGAAFRQNDQQVLSWSGNSLQVWDIATGSQIGPAMLHNGAVAGALFSTDGRHLLSWSSDKVVRMWDLTMGNSEAELYRHEEPVIGATFNHSKTRILSWSFDNTLRLWDAVSGTLIGTMKHDSWVIGAAFTQDDARILSWSDDHTLRIWDGLDATAIGAPIKHDGSVTGALVVRDGKFILSWSSDKTLRLWNMTTGESIGPIMKHDNPVAGALLSNGRDRILSWADKTLQLWDAISGAPVGPPMKQEGVVIGALFSMDDKRIVSWADDGSIIQWDKATSASKNVTIKRDGLIGATLSPDGSYILAWFDDGTLQLRDASSGLAIGPSMKHEGPITGAIANKDGSRILSWSSDKTVRLWDVATRAQIGPSMKHDGAVIGALFSDDEKEIVSWSDDKTLKLWNATWRGANLLEVACNHTPQMHNLTLLSARYDLQVIEPICQSDQRIPTPNWDTVQTAPR
jgi:WD40 repeat protein